MEKIVKQPISELHRVANAAADGFDYVKQGIEQGQLEFFSLSRCYFVTTREETTKGAELVIVCAEGENLANAAQTLKEYARRANYRTVRIHAFRKGMRRLLNKLDFEQAETVFRLTL